MPFKATASGTSSYWEGGGGGGGGGVEQANRLKISTKGCIKINLPFGELEES